MKPNVYCVTTSKGVHSFYLEACGEIHYLFSQGYKRGVSKYYGKGVNINDALDPSRAKRNTAVLKTMSKMPSYIRYIEKEYGIEVLKQTSRKHSRHKKSAA